jgi:hypothetical protein
MGRVTRRQAGGKSNTPAEHAGLSGVAVNQIEAFVSGRTAELQRGRQLTMRMAVVTPQRHRAKWTAGVGETVGVDEIVRPEHDRVVAVLRQPERELQNVLGDPAVGRLADESEVTHRLPLGPVAKDPRRGPRHGDVVRKRRRHDGIRTHADPVTQAHRSEHRCARPDEDIVADHR